MVVDIAVMRAKVLCFLSTLAIIVLVHKSDGFAHNRKVSVEQDEIVLHRDARQVKPTTKAATKPTTKKATTKKATTKITPKVTAAKATAKLTTTKATTKTTTPPPPPTVVDQDMIGGILKTANGMVNQLGNSVNELAGQIDPNKIMSDINQLGQNLTLPDLSQVGQGLTGLASGLENLTGNLPDFSKLAQNLTNNFVPDLDVIKNLTNVFSFPPNFLNSFPNSQLPNLSGLLPPLPENLPNLSGLIPPGGFPNLPGLLPPLPGNLPNLSGLIPPGLIPNLSGISIPSDLSGMVNLPGNIIQNGLSSIPANLTQQLGSPVNNLVQTGAQLTKSLLGKSGNLSSFLPPSLSKFNFGALFG
ncbi:uncharacterized protein LOC132192717 [Neocloeon triangulifer]|uniref:uncharacterized protein LOC132192717 n=1 Tax=Neocloeon triangulifer TaxID=2078957 RepID=UPI00286F2469|nr:uncharacterized protein LOC132192717 [Neocloeon triangulifer]